MMTPGAARQRRYRRRQRNGLMVIQLGIHHVSVAESLIAAGLLAPADYEIPTAIAAALERAVIEIKKR